MTDIFISYARPDRLIATRLAKDLRDKGYSVWWDSELLGIDDFRDVTLQKLRMAKACVVIWSPHSVKSRFVRDEADFALHYGKLIATRVSELPNIDIPFGFRGQHTDLVTERQKIYDAYEKLNNGRSSQPADFVATKEVHEGRKVERKVSIFFVFVIYLMFLNASFVAAYAVLGQNSAAVILGLAIFYVFHVVFSARY